MSTPMYGREALRHLRERQAQGSGKPESQSSLLEGISPDAPMDDAAITVWDGERFVSYDKWLATAPLIVEERTEESRKPIREGRGRPRATVAHDAQRLLADL